MQMTATAEFDSGRDRRYQEFKRALDAFGPKVREPEGGGLWLLSSKCLKKGSRR